MVNKTTFRITGVRLKPPRKDARQYSEDRSNENKDGPAPSNRIPSRSIYSDLRAGRHTEAEKVAPRRQRGRVRAGCEQRERAHLRALRAVAIEDVRPSREESSDEDTDDEGWGIRATRSD